MAPPMTVSEFFRSIILRSPQGWAWLAGTGALLVLAAAAFMDAVQLPMGKTPSAQATACLLWPIVTFVLLVKWSIRSTAPSWSSAAGIALVSAAPLLYGYWRHLTG